MYSVFALLIVTLFVAQPCVSMNAPVCTLGRKPIDAELFGKKASARGCGRGGSTSADAVRIEPWAVIYQPFVGTRSSDYLFTVCPEEISVVYVRGKRIPMMYYRGVKFGEFQKKADCSKIPVRKITAWGKDRKEYSRRLKSMADGLKELSTSFEEDCYIPANAKLSRAQVNARIQHVRITTAALTLINGVAFNSFLCL